MNVWKWLKKFLRWGDDYDSPSAYSNNGYYLEAAGKGRKEASWIMQGEQPNINLYDLATVRSRADYLYNNNSYLRGALDMLVNRAAGAGAQLQAKTASKSFNAKAEALWEKWQRNAEYFGQYCFQDLQRLAVSALYKDGGIFFHIVPSKDNSDTAPFKVEVLEYSRLAMFLVKENDNYIWAGVEIDYNTGMPVAYHFLQNQTYNPLYPYTTKTIRIPANEIIHFSPYRRPHELLGIPLLAPAISSLYHLHEIIEAELINAKVSASYGLIIKKNNAAQAVMDAYASPPADTPQIEIAPGMVEYLQPGEDVTELNAQRPGNNFSEFVKIILRGVARTMGLSYEQITGDKSAVNYSSARHSELELRDYLYSMRKALERYVLDKIYEEFIKYAVTFGNLNAVGAIKNWQNFTDHKFIWKGNEWVDPVKEAQARQQELMLGLTTLADEAAAMGKDWEEILEQRAKEKQKMQELGLTNVVDENLALLQAQVEAQKASATSAGSTPTILKEAG